MCPLVVALGFFALVFIQKGGGGISGNRVHLFFFLVRREKEMNLPDLQNNYPFLQYNRVNLGGPFLRPPVGNLTGYLFILKERNEKTSSCVNKGRRQSGAQSLDVNRTRSLMVYYVCVLLYSPTYA